MVRSVQSNDCFRRLAFEAGRPQSLASHLDIVKRKRAFARDLHLLVSLSGKQHDVSRVRFCNRQSNRLAAVRLRRYISRRFSAVRPERH